MKKRIIISIALSFCLFLPRVYGQEYRYQDFAISLTLIQVPALANQCRPVYCLLKVDTDKDFLNFRLTPSDSADSLFVKSLAEHPDKIDFNSLRTYLRQQYPSSAGPVLFYIPLIIYTIAPSADCTPQPITFEQLAKYSVFGGKPMKEIAVFLPQVFFYIPIKR